MLAEIINHVRWNRAINLQKYISLGVLESNSRNKDKGKLLIMSHFISEAVSNLDSQHYHKLQLQMIMEYWKGVLQTRVHKYLKCIPCDTEFFWCLCTIQTNLLLQI